MITQLRVQNFGLIDELSLEFGPGLNILTGETGAGKSILIDALRYGLGDSYSVSWIRDQAQPISVEVVCESVPEELARNPVVAEFLDQGDRTLIIARSQHADGRKKTRVNGRAVTLAQLRELGDHLVDFHGPHDHQSILRAREHLHLLDKLIDFGSFKNDYVVKYQAYVQLQSRLRELEEAVSSRDRELDFLNHQIAELEQVPLEEAEWERVSQEKNRLNNSEKLHELVCQLSQILEDEESGVERTLARAFGPLKGLSRLDETTISWAEELRGIQESAQVFLARLSDYQQHLSFDPQRARDVNHCYDAYDEIQRKYGPGLPEAREFYRKAKARHQILVNLEQNDAQLRRELSQAQVELNRLAAELTKRRTGEATGLKRTIEKELADLGMKHVRFECRIDRQELDSDGADRVEFYISPNAGEALKPLADIVSSGEAARLMLALKKALTLVDPIPVLIFDEIDAQIGGRLGTVTGQKLKELSRERQVILITHLPQIASFADRHVRVEKRVRDGRTSIAVIDLDEQGRVKEMAQMMSGDKESRISVEHALEMRAKARAEACSTPGKSRLRQTKISEDR